MTQITIGRPVYGRPVANEEAKRVFGGATFPLNVEVSNRLTVALSLPEAGIQLTPLASTIAVFSDFDRLQRTVSSLEQIARLNDVPEVAVLGLENAEATVDSAPEEAQEDVAQDHGKGDGTAKQDVGQSAVTIVQDDDEAFVVELDGVQFEPQRNQVRDDNSLTSGGIATFNEAKAAAADADK